MQIDLAKNLRSNVFQGNINSKCHQMVLSSSFFMHYSGSRLSAIKGGNVPLAQEERTDSVNSEKMAVIMAECSDSYMKYFGKMSSTGKCFSQKAV